MKRIKVCLIVEGTYPYIMGGVSRWVHDLVTDLNDVRFSILHLRYGSPPEHAAFDPPDNVEEVVNIPMEEFHDADVNSRWWSSVMKIPDADIYHALATGFAGVLGVQIKNASKRPFLLTEHGIYWREVQNGSDELECGFKITGINNQLFGVTAERHHWCKSLRGLAAEAYAHADRITTVARVNLKYQWELGARPDLCRVIPNGVRKTTQVADDPTPHFAFVGRVTPIKDVTTCLLAMARVRDKHPNARFSIVGPLQHDPEYVAHVQDLAKKLKFNSEIFIGECDPQQTYLSSTALVLTSISEALPYVALEAMSYGVPLITTDVGDCPDLVHGGIGDNLGDAGYVTPVADPYATSDAMLAMMDHPEQRSEMGRIARLRVVQHYKRDAVANAYREIYQELGRSAVNQQSVVSAWDADTVSHSVSQQSSQ
ncbi:MAG: hypothetical protein DHS20C01_36530 [marine bacterium B5-7]|nr:MAG: hypothetical protein DHS20C01_36530 [marine bacterium B5-7]